MYNELHSLVGMARKTYSCRLDEERRGRRRDLSCDRYVEKAECVAVRRLPSALDVQVGLPPGTPRRYTWAILVRGSSLWTLRRPDN
jgi:hypothetical protein